MPVRVMFLVSAESAPAAQRAAAGLRGAAVETARGVPAGLEHLKVSFYDAVVAWFPFPEWEAAEVLEEIQRVNALVPVIVADAGATLADAVRLARLGAFQVIGGAAPAGALGQLLESAAAHHRNLRAARLGNERVAEPWRRFLIGESRPMQEVLEVVRLIGARRSTVLVTGETGTGKEMVARAIHMASPRANRPMVAVNCSALPENLLEAELFGHVRGAFTGAVSNRVGRFEQADRSTIFLDEIGEMPLELQAKLLRVLQEREFQRLGSSETIRVDVRVIAATNCDLAQRVREGKFREDLYYRLNVVPLPLPPLRERRGDIPLLVNHFIEKVCEAEALPLRRISPEALERLERYDWPGNVRQLENAVEMAIALSGDRTMLYPSDFRLPAGRKPVPPPGEVPVIALPDHGLDFEETVGRIERALLEQAMRKTGGNKKRAAEMLGLKRTTFAAKLKSLEAGGSWQECAAAICAGG